MRKIVLRLFLSMLAVCFFVGAADAQTVPKTLNWTAVGDDGLVGTATTYDIRYSVDSAALVGSWVGMSVPSNVILCSGEPTPKVAGSAELFTVSGFTTGIKYYFAMKVSDEVGNVSGISNIFSFTLLDTIAPAAVNDLR